MTTASTWRHTANSFAGEPIEIGSTVTRLDNYKGPRRGKILVIDRDRGYCYVLVRWPNLDDEWMHPGMLVPVMFPEHPQAPDLLPRESSGRR